MNKNIWKGWEQVFLFTFLQTIKGKTVKITTIVLCIAAFLIGPISTYLMDHKDTSTGSFKSILVLDETGLDVSSTLKLCLENNSYGKLDIMKETRTYDEIEQSMLDDKISNDTVLLHITKTESGTCDFKMLYKDSGNDIEKESLMTVLYQSFLKARLLQNNISETDAQLLLMDVTTSIDHLDAVGAPTKEASDAITMAQYFMSLGLMVIIVLFMSFGGESIATSIVTEKSTRVIEYLMTSIKPLAIVIGKVLAMLSVLFVQIISVVISMCISGIFTSVYILKSDTITLIPEVVKNVIVSGQSSTFSPIGMILAIFSLIIGFLLFGVMAALAGASVSKIDEMSEGLKVYNFILVIGAYLGIASSIMQLYGGSATTLRTIGCFVPISAPFVVPANVITGEISYGMAIGSIGISLACLIGLFLFVAKIYEDMIFYHGSTLKIKDMISMSKQNRKENK